MEIKNVIKILIGFILVISSINIIFADIKLDNMYFDPAIIAAGDQVDLVIEYRAINLDTDKVGNPDYQFKVQIMPDDDMSKKYITVIDKFGDNLKGTVLSGTVYNKVFRVKVANDAPALDYQFKLVGAWYKNGRPISFTREIKFTIPVKKEGIILNIANLNTIPSQIRPGDKFVEIKAFVENAGQKDAKSVEISMNSDSNLITSTYSNDNRKWVGNLKAGESKQVSFYLNIDENTKPGTHKLYFKSNYMDLDDNSYLKNFSLPLLIKGRSYIKVINYSGEGLAGNQGKLKVVIENTGTQDAESVDVRILKDSSQPFDFDVRSSYVGELKPGEKGVAIFNFKIRSDASIKTHDFKLLIRAKGDTDEGDDNIYTYNRRAQFKVVGVAENNYIKYGGIGLVIVVILFIFGKFFTQKSNKKKSKK